LSVLFIARTQPICTAPGCSCPVGLIQSLKQAGLIAEYKGIFVKTAISSKRRFRQNDGIQARFSLDLSAQCVDCRGIAGVLPGYCRGIAERLTGDCQGVARGLPGGYREVAGIQVPVSLGTGGIRFRSRIPGPGACQQGVQNLLHIHPP
jgi:hypothetical protein